MVEGTASTRTVFSVKLGRDAARAVAKYTTAPNQAFKTVDDMVDIALLVIGFAVSELLQGGEVGSIDSRKKTFKKVSMPFIERLSGGEGDAENLDLSGDEPFTFALQEKSNIILCTLLDSVEFKNLDDLINQALVLLSYAILAQLEGNNFGSMNGGGMLLKEVYLPFTHVFVHEN